MAVLLANCYMALLLLWTALILKNLCWMMHACKRLLAMSQKTLWLSCVPSVLHWFYCSTYSPLCSLFLQINGTVIFAISLVICSSTSLATMKCLLLQLARIVALQPPLWVCLSSKSFVFPASSVPGLIVVATCLTDPAVRYIRCVHAQH